MKKVIRLDTAGRATLETWPEDYGVKEQLNWMRAQINCGHIEIVDDLTTAHYAIVVDAEALLDSNPLFNPIATALNYGAGIFGNALLMGKFHGLDGLDLRGLDEAEARHLMTRLRDEYGAEVSEYELDAQS